MQCPACGAEVPDDDSFCEVCGDRLGDAPAPVRGEPTPSGCTCGALASEIDEEGFCTCCGRRARRPAADHMEIVLSPRFAAVSDRGLRHDRNEDRCAVADTGNGVVMVVCDGVSTTRQSEVASATVAETVIASLTEFLRGNAAGDPEAAMRQAIAAGAAALNARTSTRQEKPASTTIVAALVQEADAVIGWLGDSRAYWIDEGEVTLLTHDHSWLNEVLALGGLTAQQAEEAPQAHAITRWIGADAGSDIEPEIVRHTLAPTGSLLLCSDGLWNYVPTSAGLGELFAAASVSAHDALGIARYLVDFANERGGQDNITVALLLPSLSTATTAPEEVETSRIKVEKTARPEESGPDGR